MRVAFVSNFADVGGGGERSLLDLAVGFVGRGHEVVVAAPAEGEVLAAARAAGLETEVVPIPRPRDRGGLGLLALPRAGRAMRSLLARRRLDVVSAGGARAVLAAGAAARLAGAALVWHVRVAAPDPLDPVLLRLARRVVANSRATADRFSAFSPRLRRRVKVVPNGIEIRSIAHGPAARAAARARLGIPDTAEVVGCVGRFTPEKGQDVLARALVPLLDERRGLSVVFFGRDDTPFAEEVRRILPPGPRVGYAGVRSDLPDLLAALDVLVVPSRIEGFGRAAVEGFAAGVAVVATTAGGLPETLGAAGVLVSVGDPDRLRLAIRDLFDAPEARATFAAAGRWRAEEEFSLGACVEETERVYLDAMSRTFAPSP